MINNKIYKVIGVMTGTSMDGVDISYIKTNGQNIVKIINEKNFDYPFKYQFKLKKIVRRRPNNTLNITKYFKKYEIELTDIIINKINQFINKFNIKKKDIDLIGISGQTMYHNPQKKISIQICSGKIISNYFKTKVVSNFRDRDIKNNGEGAPIGAYYHKYLLNKINKNAIIINLGGITNFTQINKRKLISSDLGPGNAILDDLTNYFYNQKFDKNGYYASRGKIIFKVLNKFKKDNFFKKKFPKSLDRNYFKLYFKKLIKFNKNDALKTAANFTIFSITNNLDLKTNSYINEIILTGGGRKNIFIIKCLKNNIKKIKLNEIDNYGYNGDLLESQMFAYLAVRSVKKLTISGPTTTGVKKYISGGKIYKSN